MEYEEIANVINNAVMGLEEAQSCVDDSEERKLIGNMIDTLSDIQGKYEFE